MNRKLVFAVTAAAVLVGNSVFAQSSKAAWRFSNLVSLPAADAAANPDTGWNDILTTRIKTPNAKELAMGVSLQCGLVTDTTVRSKNGDLDSSAARGRIRVRVKLVQPNGSVTYGQPANGTDLATDISLPPTTTDAEGVTYCDRYQKLQARFSGLNCTADLTTGIVTCADPEELSLILKTLNAQHFNFIHANAIPGVHTVVVQARAEAGIALGGTQLGAAGANAFAGAGALSVETIRLIRNADGTTDLEDLR